MGNEALTNQRHLLRMLVEQRITIEGGIQTVIELRGKKGCGNTLCKVNGM